MFEGKDNRKFFKYFVILLDANTIGFSPVNNQKTILNCYEATAQRINAVQPPRPKTMNENCNRKETLTSYFSLTIANIRETIPNKCPFVTHLHVE